MPTAVRSWTVGELRLIRLLQQELCARWGQCFASAQAAVLLADGIGIHPHRLTYCEGYASLPDAPAPFRHAWCLLNDQVWDPTPQLQAGSTTYAGREIPTELLKHTVERRGVWESAACGDVP